MLKKKGKENGSVRGVVLVIVTAEIRPVIAARKCGVHALLADWTDQAQPPYRFSDTFDTFVHGCGHADTDRYGETLIPQAVENVSV